MKSESIKLMLFTAIVFSWTISTSAQSKSNNPIQTENRLLDDENFDGWVFYLKDKSVDPKNVFTLQGGVLHVSGNPFGYMRTKKSYSDYKLHVEYRWPVEATNSGIWVHAQLPDTIWITGIECQLQAGNAGDFACVGETDMKERVDKTKKGRMIKKMADSSEKPVGEWNTVDVVCKGNSIELTVNGILQNKASEVSVSKGYICLQSEGKEIEFRNVILTKF